MSTFVVADVIVKGPSDEYEVDVAQSLIRDLDAVIEKLNTSFQQEIKQEIEARSFFLD